MSQLSWNLQVGAASWSISDAASKRLLQCLTDLILKFEELDDELPLVPPGRHDVCTRACSSKHAVEWIVTSGLLVDCPLLKRLALHNDVATQSVTLNFGLRRGGSGLVRWESPLVALQRAEGFLILRRKDGELLVWRLAPLTTQTVIYTLVQEAAAVGTPLGNADAHAAAAADVAGYAAATAVLQAQIERVRAGGEPWTLEERLAKLERLERMARSADGKPDSERSDMEKSVVEAIADARSELGLTATDVT